MTAPAGAPRDYRMDYSALETGRVAQGAADWCREHGHATYVRDGVDQGYCPRCLEGHPVGRAYVVSHESGASVEVDPDGLEPAMFDALTQLDPPVVRVVHVPSGVGYRVTLD